ncbi:PEP-CTERM sorting domain-containing protein [Planctomycetales bacterium ZRK34]|nr:PEP-CTERM sorting domain-containing protein [Planctomycetales bacterium ZRK34]
MWRLDLDDPITSRLRIAVNNAEPSGIFDISELVGYAPGSVFIASNLSGSTAPLNVLISPSAVAIPEPATVIMLGLAAIGLLRRRR